MKMLTARLGLLGCVLGLLAVEVSAQGEFDGSWSGQTSQGQEITFEVQDDVMTALTYGVTYDCPDGVQPAWGHGRGPNLDVSSGEFEFRDRISPDNIIDPGWSFPAIIGGVFIAGTDAEGRIVAGLAAFNGVGSNTEACRFIGTWTAQKSPVLDRRPRCRGDYDYRSN